MKFSFRARIYKVGINPCVDVPSRITCKMNAIKGYIPVKGIIKNHFFTQTLVPVRNADHRLYVNGHMLKGSNSKPGDIVRFTLEQDAEPQTGENINMPEVFKKQLQKNKLEATFKSLTPYRQKEILRYLNHLKTAEALQRNIDKITAALKENNKTPLSKKQSGQ